MPQLLPERFEHDGLSFKLWTTDDAAVLSEAVLRNLEHLRGYMPWISEEPLDLIKRRELLAKWDRERRDGGDTIFGVFVDDDFVAASGLHRRIGPGGLEIGYWVDVDHLGQGIARRASTGLTSLAFTMPGIEIVEIHHDLTNVRSRRIPEQLGFHHIGQVTLSRDLAPEESGIDVIWRMTRDEWQARAAG